MTIPELKHYANIYSQSLLGAWLNLLDWINMYMAIVDGPGLGSRWLGNIILIDPVSLLLSLSLQFGTYIHLLRHAYQSKKQGWLIYALRNLFKLNLPEALLYGTKAILWLGDLKCRLIKEQYNEGKC